MPPVEVFIAGAYTLVVLVIYLWRYWYSEMEI
jgi:hypothetical protein